MNCFALYQNRPMPPTEVSVASVLVTGGSAEMTSVSTHSERPSAFARYGRWLQKRPWVTAGGALVLMLLVAIPMLSLRLGFSDDSGTPEGSPPRIAYDLTAEGFGPGVNGPFFVAVELPTPGDQQAVTTITDALTADPGVALAAAAPVAEDATVAPIQVFPKTAPQDEETSDLLFPLREDVIPAAAGSDTELSSTTFSFNWLPAAGTLMIIAGILTMLVLRVSPGRALKAYVDTYRELKWAIVTVMAVLALAYVLNQSGMTSHMGRLLAETGAFFAFLSPILGWIGVAVTGSDTSANALFGALQVQAATNAGLDPVLLAAANSSGGVMGKMVSPQNLAIAAAAVGMAGREGELFRKVFGWSMLLLLLMCLIVVLQASPVLSWMVPGP